MKKTLYLSFVLGLSSLYMSAQQITHSIFPETPESCENITISLSQPFPDTSYTSTTSITKNDYTINIDVRSESSGIGLLAITPQTVSPCVGPLSSGTYTIIVNWSGTPVWGESSTSFTFDVTKNDLGDSLEITNAIALKFSTEPGLIYQIQYSEDLRHWDTSGENIAGDGKNKIVYRLKDKSKMFYRVAQITP